MLYLAASYFLFIVLGPLNLETACALSTRKCLHVISVDALSSISPVLSGNPTIQILG